MRQGQLARVAASENGRQFGEEIRDSPVQMNYSLQPNLHGS
jgi:hypothetical protein